MTLSTFRFTEFLNGAERFSNLTGISTSVACKMGCFALETMEKADVTCKRGCFALDTMEKAGVTCKRGRFALECTIWYPAAGYRNYNDGSLTSVGNYDDCWSCSPNDDGASFSSFYSNGFVAPSNLGYRARGRSVRCLSE